MYRSCHTVPLDQLHLPPCCRRCAAPPLSVLPPPNTVNTSSTRSRGYLALKSGEGPHEANTDWDLTFAAMSISAGVDLAAAACPGATLTPVGACSYALQGACSYALQGGLEVLVVSRQKELGAALGRLRREAVANGRPAIAIDLEWRPDFRPDSDNPVALVQLAAGALCVLVRTCHVGFPAELQSFLRWATGGPQRCTLSSPRELIEKCAVYLSNWKRALEENPCPKAAAAPQGPRSGALQLPDPTPCARLCAGTLHGCLSASTGAPQTQPRCGPALAGRPATLGGLLTWWTLPPALV